MTSSLLCLLLAAALATGCYFLWAAYTRAEVARNYDAITANGSADDLRRGFHQRESWRRFWPWLGCAAAPNLPLLWVGWLSALLAFAALGLLLLGYFARYFSPLLNLARNLPEFKASSDSASWPDATAWVEVRKHHYATNAVEQAAADTLLQQLLARTWLCCRLGAGVLALGAVAIALIK